MLEILILSSVKPIQRGGGAIFVPMGRPWLPWPQYNPALYEAYSAQDCFAFRGTFLRVCHYEVSRCRYSR